ncbi:hypothetical protein FORC47_1976 [Bacillus cereus]|nr:hypothetical protein FORC47_1976 [Bacillus cereus]
MILSNSYGKNCGKYFNKLKEGVPPAFFWKTSKEYTKFYYVFRLIQ